MKPMKVKIPQVVAVMVGMFLLGNSSLFADPQTDAPSDFSVHSVAADMLIEDNSNISSPLSTSKTTLKNGDVSKATLTTANETLRNQANETLVNDAGDLGQIEGGDFTRY